MTSPQTILLVDQNELLVRAWADAFAAFGQVRVQRDDFFAAAADAMVSPANSFGIMDGGLDAAIRATVRGDVQSAVQRRIIERHHGELPVGSAEIVATEDGRWPFLVVAPTM